jgi:uncharacterized SAM-binding protein YcdF (DUF218 family)
MLIFLSKFLPPFIYPLGLACVLIGLALLLWRRSGWQRALLVVALLLLWLGGNRWVAMSLTRSLEWRYLPPAEISQAPVIVLLGGGTQSPHPPRPMVETNGAGDRLLYTAWLYQRGAAEHILITGGAIDWMAPESSPAEDSATLLELMGVPRQAMWLEQASRNTDENAENSAAVLKEKGVNRILLVTSAAHMPRAVRLFQAQGFDVVPMPTDFYVTEVGWRQMWEGDLRSQLLGLLPSAENMALTTRTLKEYVGILFYELRGWK